MLKCVFLFKTGFPGLWLVEGASTWSTRIPTRNGKVSHERFDQRSKYKCRVFQPKQWPMKCGAHHVHTGDTQVENGYVMGYKKRQVGYRNARTPLFRFFPRRHCARGWVWNCTCHFCSSSGLNCRMGITGVCSIDLKLRWFNRIPEKYLQHKSFEGAIHCWTSVSVEA